jgi:hypothetical protein
MTLRRRIRRRQAVNPRLPGDIRSDPADTDRFSTNGGCDEPPQPDPAPYTQKHPSDHDQFPLSEYQISEEWPRGLHRTHSPLDLRHFR